MTALARWGSTLAVVLVSCLVATVGYRIHNPEISDVPATPAFFPPYSLGFTGRAGAPTNPGRIKVNEGNQFTKTQPNLFEGVHPRRTCCRRTGVSVRCHEGSTARGLSN